MKKLRFFIAAGMFCLSLAIPNHLHSQTISQTTIDVYGAAYAQGQSFTATKTGYLMKIEVAAYSSGIDDIMYLYNGANGSGIFYNPGTPAYTQTGINFNVGTNLITLDVPFPIVQGNQYSFIFQDDQGGSGVHLGQTYSNPYAGGTRISFFSMTWPNEDLYFKIWESATIPTLSEWAAIVLGFVLAGFGVFFIFRKLL